MAASLSGASRPWVLALVLTVSGCALPGPSREVRADQTPAPVPSGAAHAAPRPTAPPRRDDDDDDDDDDDEMGPPAPAAPRADGPHGDGPVRPRGNRGPAADRSTRGRDMAAPDDDEDEPDAPPAATDDERREDEEDAFKTDLLAKLLGLEDARVGVFGWVQANFTANPAVGVDGKNFLLIPNAQANAFVVQQVYLVLEQKIKNFDQLDYGFRIDSLFGVDAQNFHDTGLLSRTFAPDTFQYDPVQFYGELHLPIGRGVDLKGGRFFALPGYESATAPGRPLLSTSDAFSFGAHPYTQFGVMTTWRVTDQFHLYNGAVNGWNRWINDHVPWSYAGGSSWDSEDERTNLTCTLNAGPTQFPRVFPPANRFPPGLGGRFTPRELLANPRLGDRNSNTALFNSVLIHQWTEALTSVVETNAAVVNDLDPLVPGRPRRRASYYGLTGWLLNEFTEQLTGVARAEVFRDHNGLLTGFADTYYETTLGLIYKPFPWLWFRPEARIDWSRFNRPFANDRSNAQFTFGFDMIFLF